MRGRGPLALLGLVVLAGALLRIAGVGQNLFGDELFAYFEVHGRSLGGVFDQLRAPPVAYPTEVSPPLFFVLAWAADALGDPVALRVPSLLAGTGAIAVVWALGRRVAGEGAGLVGAAVLALSPYAIFYSQEARPYALMMLLVALSTLGALGIASGRGRGWWGLYAVAAVGAAYTHYTAVFALAAQAGWLLWVRRDALGALLAVHLGMAVAYLPWLPSVDAKGLEAAVLGSSFAPRSLLGVLGYVFPGQAFLPLATIPGLPAAILALAGVVGAAVLVARRRPRASVPVALLLLLAAATPVGLGLYALVTGDTLLSARNLAASVPAGAALLGVALTAPRPAWAARACAAAVLFALAVGALRTRGEDADVRNSQNRHIAGVIDREARPGDAVLLVTPEAARSPLGRALAIYFARPHPYATSAGPAKAWAAIRRGRRVFLVYPAVAVFARLGPGTVLPDHRDAVARTVWTFPDRVPTRVAVFAPR